MMKMRYNVNTGLYEYCDRLTGEGIFYIFTKVGSEVAKKAANQIVSVPDNCISFYSEGDKEKSGTQAHKAGMKRLGDEAGKYAGENYFKGKYLPRNPMATS